MPRRRAPPIPDVMLHHLLSGTKASAAFEQAGLLAACRREMSCSFGYSGQNQRH